MTEYLIVDIETISLPMSDLRGIMPEFEPPGNLKDPAKIADAIEAKRQKWLDAAALEATTGSIAIIGMMTPRGCTMLRVDRDTETSMLYQFWAAVQDADHNVIVGHNLKAFDLPFIIRRSYICGVTVPGGTLHNGRLTSKFIDTMELWAAGEHGARISLNTLARVLGVGEKSGSGADFGALWATDKDAAVEYCVKDLELTRDVANRMGL